MKNYFALLLEVSKSTQTQYENTIILNHKLYDMKDYFALLLEVPKSTQKQYKNTTILNHK
jgi:hypothetical protein